MTYTQSEARWLWGAARWEGSGAGRKTNIESGAGVDLDGRASERYQGSDILGLGDFSESSQVGPPAIPIQGLGVLLL